MELASMLPGFRFLLSAIVLSTSVLIFGLGAAALLRSAHEEFVNLPSRRATPAPMFARLSEDPPTTLALLRVDPVADQPAAAPDVLAESGQTPETGPAEPEKLAALNSTEAPQDAAAKPEEPADKASVETPAPSPEVPIANTDVKIAAASVPEPDAAHQNAASPEPAADIPSFEPSIATTLIATLGGPAVQIEQKTSTTEAKPDRVTAKKKAAEQARERRRMAALRRARLAREATLTLQQQQPNPFAFPLAPATR
ncbi:hypothetical protein [Bradyrhizobium roseum]|uniref:hypothetical protein n=1 Tax=Bradyrhizobium roseum TaxID=3056648 RepID=UPI002620BD73|nr:hypothetical protein [Bradyrhizobium roseus]WKA30158.1 hypothetical protein QUH67_08315 [Bradyrhizobium roseus]